MHSAAVTAACKIIATLANNWLTTIKAHAEEGMRIAGASGCAPPLTHWSSPGHGPEIFKFVGLPGLTETCAVEICVLPTVALAEKPLTDTV